MPCSAGGWLKNNGEISDDRRAERRHTRRVRTPHRRRLQRLVGALAAPALSLRTGALEIQRHVHRVRRFVDLLLGFRVTQVVENPFFANRAQEVIGISEDERRAFFQPPHLAHLRLTYKIESLDVQRPEGVLLAGVRNELQRDGLCLVVELAPDFNMRLKIYFALVTRLHALRGFLYLIEVNDAPDLQTC